MIRGSTKQHQESRENLQAKSKKGYNAIKKTEKKADSTISKHKTMYERTVMIQRIKLIKEQIT